MNVIIKKADDPQLISNLFQYYIYDMSEYMGFPPDKEGKYEVPDSVSHLSDYWSKPDHYPYLIYVDKDLAGFSLLRKYTYDNDYFDIGQFFILRRFKKAGIGRKAFQLSVTKHPGKWITRVLKENNGAYNFWNKVISENSGIEPVIKEEKYFDKEMFFFYYEIK